MPNDHDHSHHGHEHHDHSHGDHDVDPAIEAGWAALEAGDIEAARAAARAAIDGDAPAGKKKAGAKGRKPPAAATAAPDDEDGRARLIDGLLLDAACAREVDDVEGALASLSRIAKEDPEWCTPELWIAEILSADEARRDEALRHARKAVDLAEEEDEYLSALALKAAIELDLGRPTEARKTLEGLPEADVAFDDPLAALEFAELLMDAGDVAQARARLLTLTASQPDLADGWYLLGACAEMQDDEEGKRGAWVRTRELDLEQANGEGDDEDADGDHGDEPRPTLSEEALVAAAEETLAAFPDDLRAQLKDVPIVVAEVPAAADVAAGMDPRLLGLFSGTPHAETGGVMAPAQLTEILLFRRNLERMGLDEESLQEEVRVTLLHEAGHFFGLDHSALERLGLD